MKTVENNRKRIDSRRQRRVQSTRRRILKAARTLFAENGLDLTTVDQITERADIGKGTFYYHYEDKDQVVLEIMDAMLEELSAELLDKCQGLDDLNGLLDTMIGVQIEFFSNAWEDFAIYLQGRSDLNLEESYPGLETPFKKYLGAIENLLRPLIQGATDSFLREISCAAAGFVSGYYSFAALAFSKAEAQKTLKSLHGPLASSLGRFINEAESRIKPDPAET